jgi:prefoldin subunit 5
MNAVKSILAQGLNTAATAGINTVAVGLNLNPNESVDKAVSTLSNNLDGLKTAVESPAGKEILQDASELGKDILGPAITETANVVINKSGDISKQVAKTALDAVGVVPVVGEAVEAVRAISDVVRAGEQVIEADAELAGIAAQSVQQVTEKGSEIKSALSKLTDVANNVVHDGLHSVKENMDDITRNVQEKQVVQSGGVRSIQLGGAQSAKRTHESIIEFLTPRIKTIKQTNNKSKKNSRKKGSRKKNSRKKGSRKKGSRRR